MEVIREGKPIALTAEEFKILEFFVHNQDRDVSRDELLNEVREHHNFSCLRTVDNHILKLRQKLERNPENPVHFRTRLKCRLSQRREISGLFHHVERVRPIVDKVSFVGHRYDPK